MKCKSEHRGERRGLTMGSEELILGLQTGSCSQGAATISHDMENTGHPQQSTIPI